MPALLAGMRVVEGSAFVAAPLAGMTLAQLGADVIRFDRLEGGLDHHRWPVTAEGRSLFWAGLNKGKRSLAVDITRPEGREIVQRVITAPGPDAGLFLTNLGGRGWLDHSVLAAARPDLVMVSIQGRRDGGPAVDYTVNPGVGFPMATGPEGHPDPVAHILPAWDCITGQMAALALLAGERQRRATERGELIEIALKDVALAMLGHLGIIAEVQVNGVDRPRYGNALYGAYGHDFVCADGSRVMIVALTERQWSGLVQVTGTAEEMAAIAAASGLDLTQEGNRFRLRAAITEVLRPWFAARRPGDFGPAFDKAGVTWSEFRSFATALARDPDLTPANPMFAEIEQPGVGRYLTPGSPFNVQSTARLPPRPAPRLGQHSEEILAEILDMGSGEIARLMDARIVAGPAA